MGNHQQLKRGRRMSIDIDHKYFNQIKHHLKNIKSDVENSAYYSFVCPVCGGSKSQPNKRTAGIFLDKKNEVHFKCLRQKCKAEGLGTLFKSIDKKLARQYWEEKYSWVARRNQELLKNHEKKLRDSFYRGLS